MGPLPVVAANPFIKPIASAPAAAAAVDWHRPFHPPSSG